MNPTATYRFDNSLGQRLPVIQFVKIVFQNEIVKESLINLLMSDQKTPETIPVLQLSLLLDFALADFKVSRFGDSHDALNDTENLRRLTLSSAPLSVESSLL